MNELKCTWCNKEIKEPALRHNTDPFCSQLCLDVQLEDDDLFDEGEEVLGE